MRWCVLHIHVAFEKIEKHNKYLLKQSNSAYVSLIILFNVWIFRQINCFQSKLTQSLFSGQILILLRGDTSRTDFGTKISTLHCCWQGLASISLKNVEMCAKVKPVLCDWRGDSVRQSTLEYKLICGLVIYQWPQESKKLD